MRDARLPSQTFGLAQDKSKHTFLRSKHSAPLGIQGFPNARDTVEHLFTRPQAGGFKGCTSGQLVVLCLRFHFGF